MTARDTALRIVQWAAGDMDDVLPRGDLAEATRLADPGRELLQWVGRLAAITAARLRLASPLSGDQRPPGLGAVMLAAAIGTYTEQQARLLMRAVSAPVRGADLLAYHGLVAAAVGGLPRLRGELLDLSPLTGVLDSPGPRSTARCEDMLDRLRTDPAARSMVVLRFAQPPDTPRQAQWRGECLAYLRHEDPGFVLDVYETALVHHRREHEIRARTAWRHVLAQGADDTVGPTATWWRALAELEAAEPGRIAARPQLAGRRIGTNLYRYVLAQEPA